MLPGVRLPDLLVPAAILAVGVLELASTAPTGWTWGVVLESVTALLLVGRRRWPLRTCTAAAVVMLWMPWAGPQLDEVATPILFLAVICYSLARWIAGLRGLAGLAVVLVMFFVDYLLVDVRSHGIDDAVFILALVGPPFVLGRVVRTIDDQRRLLGRQQEQIRQQAVRAERDRIARELHDVVAHSISAMVVQTAAAQDLVHRDPDRARGLLDAVAETGRQALSETGRLLHLVRDEADELGLAPAPGLADVAALVDSFRAGGLEVDATLDPPTAPLPGGVDVSAYRVVQEALTNAQRYADGRAVLEVQEVGPHLRIACRNRVGDITSTGSGLGLQGIAERASLLGGAARHGQAGDHFEVEVLLPVGAA